MQAKYRNIVADTAKYFFVKDDIRKCDINRYINFIGSNQIRDL